MLHAKSGLLDSLTSLKRAFKTIDNITFVKRTIRPYSHYERAPRDPSDTFVWHSSITVLKEICSLLVFVTDDSAKQTV